MITGSCHCGAVSFEFHGTPKWLVSCNCSACRRYGALWAHGTKENIVLHTPPGSVTAYSHGEKSLAFVSCKKCGCMTHWDSVDPSQPNCAVNMRMAPPEAIEGIRLRRFDGADTWEYLD